MRYALLLAALTVLPLSGCSDDGPLDMTSPGSELGTANPAKVAVARPFKAHMLTTFGQPGDPSFDCDGNPETPPSLIEGTGEASHLGATTYVSDSEIDFGTLEQCGRATFTAGNGDQVRFVYSGEFTFPDADGNITFAGVWVVTGGTGRFVGAAGDGSYEGTANAFVQQGEVSFLGTLVY